MDDDIHTVKKRLETKLRESSYELREFSRENSAQIERKLTSEIGRLDLRMRSLERLIWNRTGVLFVGILIGIIMATIGSLLIQS